MTTVPDSVFFSVAFSGVTNPVLHFGPSFQAAVPTVGAAGAQVVLQDSNTLAWSVDPTADPDWSIQAR
jgi:hypothetical protein